MSDIRRLFHEMVRLFVFFVVFVVAVIGLSVVAEGPTPIAAIQRLIGQVLP